MLALLALVLVLTACSSTQSPPPPPRPPPSFPTAPNPNLSHLDSVLLESPTGSTRPAAYIFSLDLPEGWEINNPRVGADSWSGSLVGDGVTLRISGGPFSVSEIYEIVGGGPVAKDSEKADRHRASEETIGDMQATLVSPRDVGEGLTGLMIQLPTGKVFITAQNLSAEQQDVAMNIFRSIRR